MIKLAAALTMVACLSACETVQPWERGTLAKPEMQWQTDIMEDRLRGQVYSSKEAASGGGGAAGGGCGCN
ncbi:MAG: DUF4266 domain-containing protein [Halioglobus sp.]